MVPHQSLMTGITALPNELLIEIFAHVNSFQVKLTCRCVSRQWLACIDDCRAWRRHFDTLRVQAKWNNWLSVPVTLTCGFGNGGLDMQLRHDDAPMS